MLKQFDLFVEQYLSDRPPGPNIRDIYDFYFLKQLYVDGQTGGSYAAEIIPEKLNQIRLSYIPIYSNLIRKQLEKYIGRKRVDAHVTMENIANASPSELYRMMQGTYRSDMKRRNVLWDYLAEYIAELSQMSETDANTIDAQKKANAEKMIDLIDKINNCTHNTQEKIFSKFSNATELFKAFEEAGSATNIASYAQKVSKDIRELKNYKSKDSVKDDGSAEIIRQQLRQQELKAMPSFYQKKGVLGDSFVNPHRIV